MMEPKTVPSLSAAIMDYFGKKPGQNSHEFLQELKQLTDQDKLEFRKLLQEIGYKFP